MEKSIILIVDVYDKNELLCGDCFSKIPTGHISGPPDYTCGIFGERLKKAKEQPVNQAFGELPLTERCSDCLLITNTKKKFMGPFSR
jgi:hypothetical protein